MCVRIILLDFLSCSDSSSMATVRFFYHSYVYMYYKTPHNVILYLNIL